MTDEIQEIKEEIAEVEKQIQNPLGRKIFQATSTVLEVFYATSCRFSYWLADLQHIHRVWPRLQLVFWGWILWRSTEWFMARPDISNAQGAVLAAISASAAAYGKFYNDSGSQGLPSDMGKSS